jgi:hypothetical protein
LTIFIGIPVLGLILVFIVELLLKDQPFWRWETLTRIWLSL